MERGSILTLHAKSAHGSMGRTLLPWSPNEEVQACATLHRETRARRLADTRKHERNRAFLMRLQHRENSKPRISSRSRCVEGRGSAQQHRCCD